MTRATSTPTMLASIGFSATARIDRPMVVRVIRRNIATTRISAKPSVSSWSDVTTDAGTEGNGDLDLPTEIARLAGEDEFEERA